MWFVSIFCSLNNLFDKKVGDCIPPTIYENKFFFHSLFLSFSSKSTAAILDESKNSWSNKEFLPEEELLLCQKELENIKKEVLNLKQEIKDLKKTEH